jgi:uncharacterized membrane protein YgaE (UPF0421/DUF939 family)
MNRPTVIAALQLSIRAATAAGLAVAFAHLLRLQYPLYALIAAVLVTDLSPSKTRTLGIPRLVGTLLGATLGGALGSLLQAGTWVLGLGIFAGMFLSQLLRLHDSAKVTAYVCGVVLLNHGHEPWSYALCRIMETVLGIGMAVLVSFVPKLLRTDNQRELGG